MNTFTIFAREMRAYFLSPMGWIVLTVFTLIDGIVFYFLGFFFGGQNPGVQSSPVQAFFGTTIFFFFVMLLFCPVVTGRLFAEERRSGTIETLLTAPVRDVEVVLGKYLAAWVFFIALWAPSVVYMILVERHADLDWGPIASGYLGTFLIGGVFIALGMLMSSLARSQIVAMALASGVTLGSFILGLGQFIFTTEDQHREIWGYINLWDHMGAYARGIVDSRNLVYYAALIAVALVATVRVLESRRWSA